MNLYDDSIARDARKILNYRKSFLDDAIFYPDGDDKSTNVNHNDPFNTFRNLSNDTSPALVDKNSQTLLSMLSNKSVMTRRGGGNEIYRSQGDPYLMN